MSLGPPTTTTTTRSRGGPVAAESGRRRHRVAAWLAARRSEEDEGTLQCVSRRDAVRVAVCAAAAVVVPRGATSAPQGDAVGEEDEVWVALSGDVASRPSEAYSSLVSSYGDRAAEFADYLARFLITFDAFSGRWWRAHKQDPKYESAYSSFVASLELSLVRSEWAPSELLERLAGRVASNPTARRHLAVAFSFVDSSQQPTVEIADLLRDTEERALIGIDLVVDEAPNLSTTTTTTWVPIKLGDRQLGSALVGDETSINGTLSSSRRVLETRVDGEPRLSAEAAGLLRRGAGLTVGGLPARAVRVHVSEPLPFLWAPTKAGGFAPASVDATPRLIDGRYRAPRFFAPPPSADSTLDNFIERDEEPSPGQYALIALCGAACASSAHLVLTPVEMAKTRRQLGASLSDLPLASYFAGADAITVGYFLAGATGFGLTALLKAKLAPVLHGEYALVAAALVASFAGTLVVAPFEAARVKCMANPGLRLGDALVDIYSSNKEQAAEEEDDDGGRRRRRRRDGPYGSIDALLLKDLSFAVVKFSAFDLVSDFLYATYPFFKTTLTASLLASLLAGTVAGVLASLVSQPADAAFTRLEAGAAPDDHQDAGALAALAAIYSRNGLVNGLYAGALERAVFAGALIALEFAIYEALKDFFHLAKDDFSFSLDVLASAIREGPLPTLFS